VIPVIAIAFGLLGSLLLWFVIGSRGAWWLKLGAIVVTTTFTFVVWDALDTFSGWPTDATPPARALLLSSEVDEPHAIYVWVIGYDGAGGLGYHPRDVEPRGYRLPYSRELHAEIDRATALAKQGRRVELRRRGSGRGSGWARQSLRVYAVPLEPRASKGPPPATGELTRAG
jgi:hypothetical protein